MKVLVVEDEEIMSKLISIRLKKSGYIVTGIATSHEETMLSIVNNMPDIILMDINIPGEKNGIETAKDILILYDIPVIYITAHFEPDTLEKTITTEPYGFLLKPIDMQGLVISIEISYHKHQANKKVKELEKEKMINEMILFRSQRLASLGELTTSIAHEIRQPLQVIKVAIDSILFLNKNINIVHPDFNEIIIKLEKASAKTEKINNIISNLSEMINQKRSDNKTEILINTQIENIISFFEQKLSSKFIKLKLNLSGQNTKSLFNLTQFEQVFVNLVNNAIEAYTNIKKPEKMIRIKTYTDPESVYIEIIDNAKGIKKEIASKIFEPFFTTQQNDISMGLGLYIVSNIMTANNGLITFENNEYGGATFKLKLEKAQGEI